MKEIQLDKGYRTKVDDDDFDRVSALRLNIVDSRKNVAISYYDKTHRRSFPLARLIIGVTDKSLVVDHINGDTLDNQKSNLRACTPYQNSLNKGKWREGATSKYKGVQLSTSGRWIASITANKRSRSLGMFPTEIEAAIAYNEAAKKYHGEFARLNEIPQTV